MAIPTLPNDNTQETATQTIKNESAEWGNELIPPEGHDKVGIRVFEVLEEVLDDKESRGLAKKWTRNYELTRNKHWKKRSTARVSLVSANLIFAHRTRTINLLTDNNPTFNVRKYGRVGEDSNVYQSLLHTTEFWWTDTEQQHVFELSVNNGETYGCTIEKVRFNPDLESGLGEAETELVDPFYFGMYPTNTLENQKAMANLHYYPMTVREARRMWPDMADEIKSDKEILKSIGDDREEMTNTEGKGGWISSVSNVLKNFVSNSDRTDADDGEEKTLIVECWVKDYTMVKEEVEIWEDMIDPSGVLVIDPETNAPVQELKGVEINEHPKYPGHVRCIWACNGGQTILDDRGNPSINPNLDQEKAVQTYLYDKFPFTLTQSISDTTDP